RSSPGGSVRTSNSASPTLSRMREFPGTGMSDAGFGLMGGTTSGSPGLTCTNWACCTLAGGNGCSWGTEGCQSRTLGWAGCAAAVPARPSATTRLVIAAIGVRRPRRGVVGCFLRNENVMRMTLLHRCPAHHDEAGLRVQLLDVAGPAI